MRRFRLDSKGMGMASTVGRAAGVNDEARKHALLQMGFAEEESRYIDVVWGRKWDSCTYAYGATITRHNSRMFNDVGVASRKNLALSNMDVPQRFPAPEAMSVHKISILFSKQSDERAIEQFIEAAVFRFFLLQKWFVSSPLIALPREDRSAQRAPLKRCLSCTSCFVGLKCEECGAPEWKYLEHAGEAAPETLEKDGVRLVVDLSAQPLRIVNQMNFYAEFDMDNVTLPFTNGDELRAPFALRYWVILEGWNARPIC